MESKPTATLARFAANATFEGLPAAIVHEAKRTILDTVGSAIGGNASRIGTLAVDLARDLGGRPESTLLGAGGKVSCTNAAFANGQLANALDTDSLLMWVGHHSPCAVIPALAVGERTGASGADVVLACAIAFDVAARIVLSLEPYEETADGRTIYSPVWGFTYATFAATIGAGKVLGLTETEMESAIGIAGASAPIPVQGRWFVTSSPRPMTKYGFYGAYCEAGVKAALLAKKGFTGDRGFLDGDRGFWRIVGSRSCNWDLLTRDLGDEWWITRQSFKRYPGSMFATAPIDLFLELTTTHALRREEIDRVVVGHDALRPPSASSALPVVMDSEADVFGSLPYLIAVASLGSKPSAAWLASQHWNDPAVRSFASKVRVEHDPACGAAIREQIAATGHFLRRPVRVTVEARGQSFTLEADHASGDPVDGMSLGDAELIDKFGTLASPFLAPGKAERAVDALMSLDQHASLDELMRNLA